MAWWSSTPRQGNGLEENRSNEESLWCRFAFTMSVVDSPIPASVGAVN
jgi:hypothetical protein